MTDSRNGGVAPSSFYDDDGLVGRDPSSAPLEPDTMLATPPLNPPTPLHGGPVGAATATAAAATAAVVVATTTTAVSNDAPTTGQPSPVTASSSKRSESAKVWRNGLRCLLLEVPLALALGLLLVAHWVRTVHRTYYEPLIERAHRTDAQLVEEYTYYRRDCTESDLSTSDFSDLLFRLPTNSTAAATPSAVETVLQHGAVVLPHVLSAPSVEKLRQYIVHRNAAVTSAERYPVSQGHHRISYGIDATEHPAVAAAVAEIAAHPIVRQTLQDLLGDPDPASAEITAITGYYGCPDQVWHPDTKTEGNALHYARSYSHSYSLFVALQDTSHTMGATDVCPGSQYCSNSLETLCDANKIRLSGNAPGRSVWRAGDGALLNQHVWHRGSAHRDPNAPERIVFIMSFLARPQWGKTDDVRQLARGTYFHQKWLMWGHTYQDLLDPLRHMRRPFSILRCLSLWKARHRNWGYDLVSAVFLRFSNGQLESDDLPERFAGRLDQLGFPLALRGRILLEEDGSTEQKVAWTTFFSETIERSWQFALGAYALVLAVYLVIVAVAGAVAAIRTRSSTVRGPTAAKIVQASARRGLTVHLSLGVLAAYAHWRVVSSEWAHNVRAGRALMRPFPPIDPSAYEAVGRLSFTDAAANAGIFKGLTTWPQRNDVLLGTRYDARFLGSYDRWLDFHPGNAALRPEIRAVAPWYASQVRAWLSFSSSLSLPPPLGAVPALQASVALPRAVLEHLRREVGRHGGGGGRLLKQDPRTGNWRVLTENEAFDALHEELVSVSHSAIMAVRKELDYAVASARFGLSRGTAMARRDLGSLLWLKQRILRTGDCRMGPCRPTRVATPPSVGSRSFRVTPFRRSVVLSLRDAALLPRRSSTPADAEPLLRPGTVVNVHFPLDGYYYPGAILSVNEAEDKAYVSYFNGDYEEVKLARVAVRAPVVEGSRVMGCYEPGLDDCFPGTIRRVHPSGAALIAYEADGKGTSAILEWHDPADYYLPPYMTFMETD